MSLTWPKLHKTNRLACQEYFSSKKWNIFRNKSERFYHICSEDACTKSYSLPARGFESLRLHHTFAGGPCISEVPGQTTDPATLPIQISVPGQDIELGPTGFDSDRKLRETSQATNGKQAFVDFAPARRAYA